MQQLVASGIAVLCAQRPPGDASELATGPDMQGAILNAARFAISWRAAVAMLVDQGLVDRSRVGGSGHSQSGLALAYALSRSDLFSVAATATPPGIDPFFVYFWGAKDSLYRRPNVSRLPMPDNDPEGIYAAVSPALNAAKIKAPLLMQLAENEYLGALQLQTHMISLNKPLEIYVFPDEGHNFMQPQHTAVAMERNLDWFKFWLLGEVDPLPEKAAQYRRWNSLKNAQQAARSQ
jgi:dipeptidyl aminopeptidase/acylaminoacyl peptidase